MSKLESIEELQSAEIKAKEIIERANSSELSRIQKAESDAIKIVEDAEARAKEIKAKHKEEVLKRLEVERKRKIAEAQSKAARIRGSRLSNERTAKIIKKSMAEILGA